MTTILPKKMVLLPLLSLVPGLALGAPAAWTLDRAHSQVGFAVKHLVISTVRGEFKGYDAAIVLDDADPAKSSAEATIDVSSVDTGVPDRDAHLRSPDFFDAARFPAMTFRSTKVERAGKDRLKVTGDLTVRGVTRPVVLDVTITPEVRGPAGDTRRGLSATARIDRKDFGLAWNKVVEAGPVVGDEIVIAVDAELVKAGQKTAANR